LTGSGPLQWVFAGIIVAAFAIGAFLFVRKRLDPA
jgi:lysozyme